MRETRGNWQLKDKLSREEIEILRELWDEGEASGGVQPVDFAKVTKEIERRLKKECVAKNIPLRAKRGEGRSSSR